MYCGIDSLDLKELYVYFRLEIHRQHFMQQKTRIGYDTEREIERLRSIAASPRTLARKRDNCSSHKFDTDGLKLCGMEVRVR
jgi:hypothetical protein